MTGLALGPQVVGNAHLKHTVTIGILEKPTATDAIGVLLAVELIAHGEVHPPFSCHIQALANLTLHTGTDG